MPVRPFLWGFTSMVLVIACLCSAHSRQIKPKPVAGKINWHYDYQKGQQEAARTGKPLFVVFRCER